jgi:hypothetical protein
MKARNFQSSEQKAFLFEYFMGSKKEPSPFHLMIFSWLRGIRRDWVRDTRNFVLNFWKQSSFFMFIGGEICKKKISVKKAPTIPHQKNHEKHFPLITLKRKLSPAKLAKENNEIQFAKPE